jgi:hypothetical protein
MKTKQNKTEHWETMKAVRYLPFEHPSAATLIYSFSAGILASLGATLLMIPPLSPTPRVCTAILLTSAFLFFISSGGMVWISFELEAFKEDLINVGSPRGTETRRQILEKTGLKHEGNGTQRKQFSRLWRLWIAFGISFMLALCAFILVWAN